MALHSRGHCTCFSPAFCGRAVLCHHLPLPFSPISCPVKRHLSRFVCSFSKCILLCNQSQFSVQYFSNEGPPTSSTALALSPSSSTHNPPSLPSLHFTSFVMHEPMQLSNNALSGPINFYWNNPQLVEVDVSNNSMTGGASTKQDRKSVV